MWGMSLEGLVLILKGFSCIIRYIETLARRWESWVLGSDRYAFFLYTIICIGYY